MPRQSPRRFPLANPTTSEVQLESRQLMAAMPGNLIMREWSGGLNEPTTFVSDHENWIYVGELGGRISRVSTKDGHSEPLLKLPAENVDARGLYSLALDPGYGANGRLYAFYYGLSARGGREAKVSRIDLNSPGRPETVLIEIPIKNVPKMHHGGALEVDNQGYLYFAIGDLGESKKVKNLDAPNGKVFRIRTDGSIPKDNPFYKKSRGLGRAVWASGVREPMNSSLDRHSGVYLIHDVGWYQVEEIDQITRGGNYGWPYYEGTRLGQDPGKPSGNNRWPIYSYRNLATAITKPRNLAVSKKWKSDFELRPQDEGCAVMGGAFYMPTGQVQDAALTSLVGDYLFADLCGGWINAMDFNTKKVSQFASDLATQILNIDYTNDGRIFVLARGDTPSANQIMVIEPLKQAPPVITHVETSVVSSINESVTFQADISGLGPITYQWQRNGTNIHGATQSTLTIPSTNTSDSPGEYRLTATNSYGPTTSTPWTLTVLDRPRPDAMVTVSKEGGNVKAGEVVNFSATASDAVDGHLPASNFSWTLVLHHNDHTHPLLQSDGVSGGSFVVGDYSFERGSLALELTLTVTNSAGLSRIVKKSWQLGKTV